MVQRIVTSVCAVSLLAVAYGCSSAAGTPLSPTAAPAGTDAAADGSTLKVTAPVLVSPINTVQLDTLSPQFTLLNSSANYAATPALTYRFEVSTPAGAVVGAITVAAGNGTTTWQFPSNLVLDTTYRWRARAELGADFGPWSGHGTFRSLDYRGLNPRPANGVWPRTTGGLLAYISNTWPTYLETTDRTAERIENMEFLRDRIIEAGICGGLDLAYNRKRGFGEHSTDALAWRMNNGDVEVIDVALGFDDKTNPLVLVWQIVEGPSGYDPYPNHPGC